MKKNKGYNNLLFSFLNTKKQNKKIFVCVPLMYSNMQKDFLENVS